jgi:hypothetical protein
MEFNSGLNVLNQIRNPLNEWLGRPTSYGSLSRKEQKNKNKKNKKEKDEDEESKEDNDKKTKKEKNKDM